MADAPRLPCITDIRTEDGRVELDLEITADLLWFQGHFPDLPILPGVVQLDWAVHFARAHLGLALPAARQFQVKYKSGIFPGDRITLALTHQVERGRLSFDYRRDGAVCATGQVTVTAA